MQSNKLYVGNLDYSVTKNDLENLFAEFGQVRNVNVIENKGFGFVEMSNTSEAIKARDEMDGSVFKGRAIKVSEARPQQKRGRGQKRDFRR